MKLFLAFSFASSNNSRTFVTEFVRLLSSEKSEDDKLGESDKDEV